MNSTGAHRREITQHDGVSDETAIMWSDQEDANRRDGVTGKHRS